MSASGVTADVTSSLRHARFRPITDFGVGTVGLCNRPIRVHLPRIKTDVLDCQRGFAIADESIADA